MSTIAQQVVPTAVPADEIWRLRVVQYHAMIRAGILTEDDPVELLQGWLVTKMPKSPAHRAVTRLLRAALERHVPQGWYVDTQEPITTATSEPEPDVVIVRGETRDYLDRHPGAEDVALVVEVADSSLAQDRGLKMRAYAEAGIPSYWIVNLQDKVVEVYADPTGDADEPDYRSRQRFGPDELVSLVIEKKEIAQLAPADFMVQ